MNNTFNENWYAIAGFLFIQLKNSLIKESGSIMWEESQYIY
ncbi:hypothetical protein EMIT079MI2_420017 [Bacillus sp. IT-79MI2]